MRFEDWPERLDAYIQEKMHVPFSWGYNDCTRFAHGAEQAQCGFSRFDKYKQSHKSRKAAFAYLKRISCASTWDLFDRHCTRIPISLCQRGDFVGHISGDGQSIGVCLGNVFACPSDDGLAMLPMSKAQIGWSIDG